MAISVYIYYRVAAGRELLAQQRVSALLERVRASSGVRGRLLKKRGDSSLWMEVYEGVPPGGVFEATVDAGVRELALDEILTQGSPRRIECFED